MQEGEGLIINVQVCNSMGKYARNDKKIDNGRGYRIMNDVNTLTAQTAAQMIKDQG